VMTVNAFETGIPGIGKIVLTLIIIMFSISTMISYSYYSLKCSRYLFGYKFGSYYVYIYILSLPVAAVWCQDTVINLLDTMCAMMAIPKLTGALLLSPKVVAATKDYFKRMNI